MFQVSMRVLDHWCKQPSAWANLSVAERKDHAVTTQGHGADRLDAAGAIRLVVHFRPRRARLNWDYNLTCADKTPGARDTMEAKM